MLEATVVAHAGIQCVLSGVPERRVPQVMGKTNRFRERLAEPERNGHRTADLRDLERVRQARTIQVTFVVDEYLRLVNQPAKRRGMDNAVAVALILTTISGADFFVTPSPRPRLIRGVWRECRALH
jgi:hypothetical protein